MKRLGQGAVVVVIWLGLCGAVVAQEEPSEPETGEVEATGDQSGADDQSDEGESGNGWIQSHALQARINPLGLAVESYMGYRLQLFDSDSMLLKNTRLDVGLATRLSPAYIYGGPYIEFIPLAFLKLRVVYNPMFYFGTFGSLADYGTLQADWSPDRVDEVDEQGLTESGFGHQLYGSATIQLLVSGIVALYENRYTMNFMDLDGPYYDASSDFLLAPDDAIWTMNGTLGYLFGPGSPDIKDWNLLVAARYDRHVTREGDFSRQLLGAAFLFRFPPSLMAWGSPSLTTLVQNYLEDEYYEGEWYFALQFKVSFD